MFTQHVVWLRGQSTSCGEVGLSQLSELLGFHNPKEPVPDWGLAYPLLTD